MSNQIITGIDIGTHTVKVVVSEMSEQGTLRILGIGTSPSNGLRNGYIVDLPTAVTSVSKALDSAVKSARMRPSTAYLSIGGISLTGIVADGVSYIRHGDGTITDQDFEKAMIDASTKSEALLINKKTIHDIPLSSKVDGEHALRHPVGLRGSKLENTVMLIHALEGHIDDFVSAVEDAGVEVIDVTAGPLAASFASVSTPQKMQGCVLLDIGSESTDVIVFDGNTPIALKVVPHGSNDVTHAIAIELKVPLHEAEQIKRGSLVGGQYSQAAVDKIIAKSSNKLFTEVKAVLKELTDDTMLPSGVLITGGGARLHNIEVLARDALKLPTKIVSANEKQIIGNPEFSIAYGLCIWGASNDTNEGAFSRIKKSAHKIAHWFKQFLP
jgi:cell division protein FtsA